MRRLGIVLAVLTCFVFGLVAFTADYAAWLQAAEELLEEYPRS